MSTMAELRRMVKNYTTDYDGRRMEDGEETLLPIKCGTLREMMKKIDDYHSEVGYLNEQIWEDRW